MSRTHVLRWTPNRRWMLPVGVGLGFLVAFVTLGLLVRRQPLPLDAAIAEGLRDEWRSPMGRVAAVVTDVFGPVVPVLLGVLLLLAALRRWRAGDRARAGLLLRVTLVLGLCRLTSVVFKPVFDRDRPREYADLSYPSGHVVAVASAGFALVLLCRWVVPWLLWRVVVAVVVATLISAVLRMYVGVHWFSDTVGAVLAVTGVGLLASALVGLLPAERDPVSVQRRRA